MPYALFQATVTNFAKWKAEFLKTPHIRKELGGLEHQYVLQDIEKASQVTVLFTVEEVFKAKKFLASTRLRDAWLNAGVIGKPKITFLS